MTWSFWFAIPVVAPVPITNFVSVVAGRTQASLLYWYSSLVIPWDWIWILLSSLWFNVNPLPLDDNKVLVQINSKFYRPAEVELLLGDSNKARKELGWSPKISFDKLVEKMVRWDIENSKP